MNPSSLQAHIRTLAKRLGPKTAISQPSAGIDLSWADLQGAAWGLAQMFITRGAKFQQRIAILVKDSVEALVAEIAVQAAGCFAVIPPVGASVADLQAMIDFITVEFFLYDDENAQVAAGLKETYPQGQLFPMPTLGEIEAPTEDSSVDEIVDRLGPGSPAIILFPNFQPDVKGVVWTQKNILEVGRAIALRVGANSDDRWLAVAPLAHTFVRIASWYASLASGGTFSLAAPKESMSTALTMIKPSFVTLTGDQEGIIADPIHREIQNLSGLKGTFTKWAIKRQKINNPGGLERFYKGRLEDVLGGQIKGILMGWGSPSESLIKNAGALGITVFESWGLAETTGCSTLSAASPRDPSGGLPLDGVQIEILGDDTIAVQGINIIHSYSLVTPENSPWFEEQKLATEIKGKLLPDGRLKVLG